MYVNIVPLSIVTVLPEIPAVAVDGVLEEVEVPDEEEELEAGEAFLPTRTTGTATATATARRATAEIKKIFFPDQLTRGFPLKLLEEDVDVILGVKEATWELSRYCKKKVRKRVFRPFASGCI